MTEGHEPELSIDDQAMLWVLEGQKDPEALAQAMRAGAMSLPNIGLHTTGSKLP